MNMHKTALFVLCVLLLGCLLAGGACSPTPEQTEKTDELVIDLAPIHDITITLLKSNPPQVNVHIKGGLKDGCTTFKDIQTSQDGKKITIKVSTQRPKDATCPAVYTYFEKDINLGSDFVTGTIYTVKVNYAAANFTY
jgi:hypothetical protein